MPELSLDLEAYLRRIGYDGRREPTRATLDSIVAHHAESIPFENLDAFLGAVPELDPSALGAKLVDGRRGGWCFEQNLLLRAVLTQLGFTVTALAARVLWGGPADAITRRSHMLLLVEAEGLPRIVDVGFGGMVLNGSLALEPGPTQQTPLEPFRIIALGDGAFVQQTLVGGEWRATYRFDLIPQHPIDFEMANWFLATSPTSPFRTHLMAARATADRRYALIDRRLTIHHLGGETERRTLTPTEALRSLEEDFLLDTGPLPGLREALDRLD
ncbi:arylamine N-acetyltransferase family protein [Tomitella biformata]|uniref:arylamine N-acetyltransferase family protein n=1 Tax=Tomitella biformata TaxID=630403 RepID=UPI000466B929|nr:arylamine N-acetyltransferase [Tomitella biformata]